MKRKNQANILARECIVTALIQLSYKKEFSAITVSELTERAGVSRMTFYRNYTSKEEVFRVHLDELLEQFRHNIYKDKKPETHGSYENILMCCRYFERYQDFISCLLHVGLGHLLLEALNTFLLSTYYTDGESPVELYYSLLAYAGALFNIYVAWLEGGAKESVEVLANILYTRFRLDS